MSSSFHCLRRIGESLLCWSRFVDVRGYWWGSWCRTAILAWLKDGSWSCWCRGALLRALLLRTRRFRGRFLVFCRGSQRFWFLRRWQASRRFFSGMLRRHRLLISEIILLISLDSSWDIGSCAVGRTVGWGNSEGVKVMSTSLSWSVKEVFVRSMGVLERWVVLTGSFAYVVRGLGVFG